MEAHFKVIGVGTSVFSRESFENETFVAGQFSLYIKTILQVFFSYIPIFFFDRHF